MKTLQKYIVTLSLLIVFPLLIGGCLNFNRETPVIDTPESFEEMIIVISDIDGLEVADLVPIPLEKADNLVREFAKALNGEDTAKVLSCMTFSDDDYYTMEWAKVAVDNYKVYFNGEQIVKAELMGPAEYHQGLVYRLYSAGDNYKEIYLNARYIGEYIYDDLVIYDNILFYSFRAERYLEELIKGIGQNDLETIISLLTYDDYANPYPQFKAENIIRNYEASFDTETLDYGFVGTETKKAAAGNLIYVIRGFKNSVPREHEIMVAYGDGLVGIIDDWIPTK